MAAALRSLVAPPAAVVPEPATRAAPVTRPPRPDHRRAPIVEALRADLAAAPVAFSTPGHKHGAGASAELRGLLGPEVFAADVWLGTAAHDRVVGDAEALAADAWEADRSFFLVNGASSGNQALLLATLGPDDEVVVGRDLHQSLLAALVLTGARPVYVAPRLHPEHGVGLGIAPEDVDAALAAHPAAKLVALVSPSYWGVASDLAGVAEVAHARDVPIFVDEAWGAHLGFHPALPPSAMVSGADGAVASPHKLLAGLSQAAMLHLRGSRLDAARVAGAVRMTQTTSPLLPILASLDAARRQMALAGEELLELAIELADATRRRLGALPGIGVLDAAALGLPERRYDPTRLVIDVHRLGMTGFDAELALRERFGIQPELSDLVGVVCLVTLGDTPESVDRLVDAFAMLAAERRSSLAGPPRGGMRAAVFARSCAAPIAADRQPLTPRQAYFAPSRAVPLIQAAGEIAAELVVPYPPGIPVLAPGEVVSPAKIEYLRDALRCGLHVRGPADPRLATLRVVAG